MPTPKPTLRRSIRTLSTGWLVRSLRMDSVGWHEDNDRAKPLSISGCRIRAMTRAELQRRGVPAPYCLADRRI